MDKPAYESFEALRASVKARAKSQGLPLGQVYRYFYYDRFLHRVFRHAPSEFVLKGGFSMLARIPDARMTRDIDFSLSGDKELSEGIALLREAGLLDEGDFLRFEYTGTTTISGQDISRFYAGETVLFDVYGAGNKVDTLSVDLVAGCNITDTPVKQTPLNRVRIPLLPQEDYRLYPIVDQIADKLCAILEKHGDKDSSRQKDLVDLVIIVLNEKFLARKLIVAIDFELSKRRLSKPSKFVIPNSWRVYPKKLQRFVPEAYRDIGASVVLVAKMLDPILTGEVAEGVWNPDALEWETEKR